MIANQHLSLLGLIANQHLSLLGLIAWLICCIMLIVYINSQVVLFSLYTSLKMTAKSKILAKNLVKKLAIMLAPFEYI